MVDEVERTLHGALSVLSQTPKETRVSLSDGCAEMLMSCVADNETKRVFDKKAITIEALSHALRQLPVILADNVGHDSPDIVSQLRGAHYD
jgi:T-complex protein 1 subunit beta